MIAIEAFPHTEYFVACLSIQLLGVWGQLSLDRQRESSLSINNQRINNYEDESIDRETLLKSFEPLVYVLYCLFFIFFTSLCSLMAQFRLREEKSTRDIF